MTAPSRAATQPPSTMEPMADARPAPMLPLRWPGRPPGATEPQPAGPDDRLSADPGVSTTPSGGTTNAPPVDVEVRTSSRRRKTATAYWESGHIVVVVPAHVRRADRQELVDWLVGRVLAKRPAAVSSDEQLAERAAALADRYVDGVRPASIRWVTNQNKRWGSCSNATGDIRISHRLRTVPEWVLDATIVHELAHLVHADHSPRFHSVANRHPRQKDALIFLEGYSLGLRTTAT
jgi:predicted metal-dependent hydrolase